MRDKNNGRFVKGLEPYNKIKLSIRHINGIVDLYRTEGKGLSEIGKRVGRSKTVIKRVLIENGVIIRSSSETKLYSKPSSKQVAKEYDSGKSVCELIKKYNMGEKVILNMLKLEKMKIRNKKEAREICIILQKHRKVKIPSRYVLYIFYIEFQWSTQEIGNLYNVDKNTVNSWLDYHGIEKRKPIFGLRKKILAKDGFLVKSSYEKIVTGWLYDNKLTYEHEVKVLPNSRKRADFKVNNFFIEVVGMSGVKIYDENYQRKKNKMVLHYGSGFAIFRGDQIGKYLPYLKSNKPVIVEVYPDRRGRLTKKSVERQLGFLINQQV